MIDELNTLEEHGLGFQRIEQFPHIFGLESNGISSSISVPISKKHLKIISKPSLCKTSIHAYNGHNLSLLYYESNGLYTIPDIDLPNDAIWLVIGNFSDTYAMYKLTFS